MYTITVAKRHKLDAYSLQLTTSNTSLCTYYHHHVKHRGYDLWYFIFPLQLTVHFSLGMLGRRSRSLIPAWRLQIFFFTALTWHGSKLLQSSRVVHPSAGTHHQQTDKQTQNISQLTRIRCKKFQISSTWNREHKNVHINYIWHRNSVLESHSIGREETIEFVHLLQ